MKKLISIFCLVLVACFTCNAIYIYKPENCKCVLIGEPALMQTYEMWDTPDWPANSAYDTVHWSNMLYYFPIYIYEDSIVLSRFDNSNKQLCLDIDGTLGSNMKITAIDHISVDSLYTYKIANINDSYKRLYLFTSSDYYSFRWYESYGYGDIFWKVIYDKPLRKSYLKFHIYSESVFLNMFNSETLNYFINTYINGIDNIKADNDVNMKTLDIGNLHMVVKNGRKCIIKIGKKQLRNNY